MPPLVLEVGIALALGTSIVRLTTTVNRMEQSQKVSHTELIGKVEVVKYQIGTLERETSEMRAEIKESRRMRRSDDTESRLREI